MSKVIPIFEISRSRNIPVERCTLNDPTFLPLSKWPSIIDPSEYSMWPFP